MAESFNEIIQSSAWKNTKQQIHKTVGKNYPKKIVEMVKDKRKARKKWQITRNPVDKNMVNHKTQQLKREIQKL